MKIKCEYCGNFIDDTLEKCEFCGAANSNIRRTGNQVPTTIQELKQWYIDHNLPDENITRFFIGKDYSGPKAYGIYKQADGDFVVYKNKSDGSRMTRYVGKDEAYAVQELYLKLKEAVMQQKNKSSYTPSSSNYINNNRLNTYADVAKNSVSSKPSGCVIGLIIAIVIFIILVASCSKNTSYTGTRPYGYSNSSSYYSSDYDSSYNSSYDSSYSNSSSSSWWDSDWDSSDWDSSSSWDSSSWDSSSWDSDWGSSWDSDW